MALHMCPEIKEMETLKLKPLQSQKVENYNGIRGEKVKLNVSVSGYLRGDRGNG